VDKALKIRPVEATISRPDQPLRYQIIFEPLKPFSASVQLVVVRETGGRWPFELQLDGTDPDPDDTITIEANLRQTSSVTFRLSNRGPDYAPFQAFFSTDSAETLSVSPAHGLLAPSTTEGTQFSVSFAPLEYGKLQRGRLVIVTEEMQLSYEVVGAQPGYSVPTHKVSSKVDSRLKGAAVDGLSGMKDGVPVHRKSHVRHNMRMEQVSKQAGTYSRH
jgi:hypothetical protein